MLCRWLRSEPCGWLRSEPCERLETTGGGTTAASSVELVETLRPWVVAVFGFREGRGLLVPGRRRRLPGSGFRGLLVDGEWPREFLICFSGKSVDMAVDIGWECRWLLIR
jgi:hypothetical protein